MKIKSLFAGMMVCAALAACTNNDLVEDNGNQPLEGDAYVAVAISNPETSFGRVASAGGEEYGSDAENAVKNATFVFFDASGNYITNVATTLTFNKSKQQSEAVLVLKNATITPASVIAFLNAPEGLNMSQSLNNLLAAAGNYGYGANDAFAMSNSVFKADREMQIATPVDNHIKQSESEAMQSPLAIYVERVLAKVTVTDDKLVTETTTTTLDNEEVTLKPEIQGWTLSGTNKKSYILKNLAATDVTGDWVWGTNRSFWAKDMNYTNFETSQTEDLIFSPYMENKETKTLYCLENTLTWDAYQAPTVAYTHLLVTARIQNTKDNTFLSTFCNYNGLYWTEDNLKSEFVNGLKDFKKQDGEAITAKDIQFVQAGSEGNKAYMAKPVFNDNVSVSDDAKRALENKGQFMLYKDGKCYFWTPIEHFGNEGETGSIGVVRNHVYALNLTKISGMGTPIVDPEQPIIPEKPSDDNSYLAAQVNILAWKMVSQDVELK